MGTCHDRRRCCSCCVCGALPVFVFHRYESCQCVRCRFSCSTGETTGWQRCRPPLATRWRPAPADPPPGSPHCRPQPWHPGGGWRHFPLLRVPPLLQQRPPIGQQMRRTGGPARPGCCIASACPGGSPRQSGPQPGAHPPVGSAAQAAPPAGAASAREQAQRRGQQGAGQFGEQPARCFLRACQRLPASDVWAWLPQPRKRAQPRQLRSPAARRAPPGAWPWRPAGDLAACQARHPHLTPTKCHPARQLARRACRDMLLLTVPPSSSVTPSAAPARRKAPPAVAPSRVPPVQGGSAWRSPPAEGRCQAPAGTAGPASLVGGEAGVRCEHGYTDTTGEKVGSATRRRRQTHLQTGRACPTSWGCRQTAFRGAGARARRSHGLAWAPRVLAAAAAQTPQISCPHGRQACGRGGG